MIQNYYYFIPIVVVVLGVYYYFMIKKSRSIKKAQQDEFTSRFSNAPLTIEQKQVLAHGAIMANFRNEEYFSMQLEDRQEIYVNGLQGQWGATDRASSIEVLDDLTNLKRSKDFDKELPEIATSEQYKKIIQKISKELKRPIDVNMIKSTYAWDTCRAINVAKWCFWAGYLTEEEAWKYMFKASNTAKETGTDWFEYTCSFLVGRSLHGFDIDDDDMALGGYVLLEGRGSGKDVYNENPFK